jgi:hypothetical protein
LGTLIWVLSGVLLLGATSIGFYIFQTGIVNKDFTWTNFWPVGLIGLTWLISVCVAWQFCKNLYQGEIDFDGLHWYLGPRVGTVSARFDGQFCLLARFEDDLNKVDWLWLEAHHVVNNEPSHWHDLRRAVYSRANAQNLPDLI